MIPEGRSFENGKVKFLIIQVENEEESKLLDHYLGSKIPTEVEGTIELADGYGTHYICLRKKYNGNA